MLRARQYLAEGLAKEGDRQRLAGGDPNEASVVLWVRIGEIALLLGADQTRGPAGCGWEAIDVSHNPEIKASLFKVPHHGSEHSHYEATWDNLLTEDVVAALAPFRYGSTNLPKPTDVARILDRAAAGYSTARPGKLPLSPQSKKTARLLPGFAANVREIDGFPGQVRARRIYGDADWRIELANPAHQLA
jgi:beta-lactamase superfamily II metal-dependent hydrolase